MGIAYERNLGADTTAAAAAMTRFVAADNVGAETVTYIANNPDSTLIEDEDDRVREQLQESKPS